jgi:hypothetical protein
MVLPDAGTKVRAYLKNNQHKEDWNLLRWYSSCPASILEYISPGTTKKSQKKSRNDVR